MRKTLRLARHGLLLACLAGCVPRPVFREAPLAVPDGNFGVALLDIPPLSPDHPTTGENFGLKLVQVERLGPGDMGRVLSTFGLTLRPAWAGGFASMRLAKGDYYIRSVDAPYKGFCFGGNTVAFHIDSSRFTLLGRLNAPAYLARLDEAAAEAANSPTETGHRATDGRPQFASEVSLDQTENGLVAPDAAELQQAQAYLDSKLGPGSDIVPVQYVAARRPDDPNGGVDPCGALPHKTTNADLPVTGVSEDGLVVQGIFPKSPTNPYQNPANFLGGMAFEPAPGSATDYTMRLTDNAVYMDGTCHVISRGEFLRNAAPLQNLFVQLTSFVGMGGQMEANPHVRLFHRFSGDVQNCGYVITGP